MKNLFLTALLLFASFASAQDGPYQYSIDETTGLFTLYTTSETIISEPSILMSAQVQGGRVYFVKKSKPSSSGVVLGKRSGYSYFNLRDSEGDIPNRSFEVVAWINSNKTEGDGSAGTTIPPPYTGVDPATVGKGEKGDKGDTGAQGIQGIPGEDGQDGLDATATTNASELTTGTLNSDRLDTDVTKLGNDVNTANGLIRADATGKIPSALYDAGTGSSTPIQITLLNQATQNETFYNLTASDGDTPKGLYWKNEAGDIFLISTDSSGAIISATKVYDGSDGSWAGTFNQPGTATDFIMPPYNDGSGYTGLKMNAENQNLSFRPLAGANLKNTGITLGVRIDTQNSDFSFNEIDGSRIFWHENSTGGGDDAPYINVDANDYVLIGQGDFQVTKMSEMPTRDAEGMLNLIVQMNTVGNLTYYLNGSTTSVNSIDIGNYSDNLSNYIIQAWSNHPTKVFAPKIAFESLQVYEGLEDPATVWSDLGVPSKQSIPPKITVNDTSNGYTIITNGTYTEEGATAVDWKGDPVTVDISYMHRKNSRKWPVLNTGSPGKWFALYSATDIQGNTSTIQKELTVLPNYPSYPNAADYFVDASATGTGDGLTEANAFVTIDAAMTEIRSLTGRSGTDTLRIEIVAGNYPRTSQLLLDIDRVQLRSKINQVVNIQGGQEVTEWTLVASGDARFNDLPVPSRGSVFKADISSLSANFGTIKVEGSKTIMTNDIMQFYVDDKFKNIARWPDASNFAKSKYYWTGDIVPGGFLVKEPVPSFASRGTANNPVLFGGFVGPYWTYQINKVESIVGDNLQFSSGSPSYGSDNHHPVYFYNMLEELTEPGEWFLDRDSGIIYYWPEKDLSLSHTYVSTLQQPLVKITGAGIEMDGIDLKYSQDNLIVIEGTDNEFKNGSLIGAGHYVGIIRGDRNGIDNSEIAHSAEGGILYDGGGDIDILTDSENSVTNSHVHHLGNYIWSFQEAFVINTSTGATESVGTLTSNNHIHNLPSGVWKYGGNENVFSKNDMHDVMNNQSDYAAIYAFQRFDQLGNKIDQNYIHDIRPELQERHGVYAIYMDEQQSGGIITSNIFRNMPKVYTINHRSGNYVTVDNNVFDNVKAAQRLDAGALSQPRSTMLDTLLARPIDTAPWTTKYPWISSYPRTVAAIEASDFIHPIGSVVQNNIINDGQSFFTPYSIGTDLTGRFATNTNNNVINESPFIDPDNFNFNIKPSILSGNNLNAIDFNQIGIQK